MRPYITFVAIIIYTLIAGTLVIITGLFDFAGHIYTLISRVWASLIFLTAGIKVKVTGLENLDKNASYIFMSNHLSHLDTAAFMAKLPFKIRFFAKKELLRVPVFGQALYMSRHIIIDRKNIERAKQSINEAKERIKKYGFSVLVFPEGTRSKTGKMGEFKKGGFVLAIEMGIPIVPIAVIGSYNLLPAHSLLVKSGTIEVRVGSPIDVTGYTMENKQELMDKVRSEIEKLQMQK
ncbi:MAG: lysophospholipid acyltransferase family protein [bacterium]